MENEPITDRQAAAAAVVIRDSRGRPSDYLLLGWFMMQRGDRRGAMALFREALEREPNNAIAHLSLAKLLRSTGQLQQAALHCDAAIAVDGSEPEAWYERGLVMTEGGVPTEARWCFAKAIKTDGRHAGARAGLALIEARAGEADLATQYATAALVLEPGNATAHRALAMVAGEAGDHTTALKLLQDALIALPQAGPERIGVLTMIGEMQEKAGTPHLAERAYEQANLEFIEVNLKLFADREPNATRIDGLRAGFAAARGSFAAARSTPVQGDMTEASIVFVLGHPRSGNTLLENVLAMVPGASALEERPTLRAAEQRFLSKDGMVELAAATDREIIKFRDAYRDTVVQNGGDIAAPIFVDMDPMKSLRLPIIARLFPGARVLLVLRDPRDVVWSCYRTHFALTNAALDFATLEGAAHHYAATMAFVETVRAALPLAIHVVRYEELVASFDETTQAIAQFLGIPWQAEFRRFDKAARLRGVTTASERQVRRGLFDGRRQWEAHAEFMQPVAEILAPWVERFGYS